MVKYLQLFILIYKVKKFIFINKQKNRILNILNNIQMMIFVFQKKVVNILPKYIIFNIKK